MSWCDARVFAASQKLWGSRLPLEACADYGLCLVASKQARLRQSIPSSNWSNFLACVQSYQMPPTDS